MKITKIIFSLLWLLFCYFQLNDTEQYGNHDAWFWVIFYFVAAILTALSLKKNFPRSFLTAVVGFCLGAAVFRMQDAVGNFDVSAIFRATAIPSEMTKATQKPNEVDALILVGAWFGFLAYRGRISGKPIP